MINELLQHATDEHDETEDAEQRAQEIRADAEQQGNKAYNAILDEYKEQATTYRQERLNDAEQRLDDVKETIEKKRRELERIRAELDAHTSTICDKILDTVHDNT